LRASGALRDRCGLRVVLGVTDPRTPTPASGTASCSSVVPRHAPGARIVRSTSVFGYEHASVGGHAEIAFDDVRVPADYLPASEGTGLAMPKTGSDGPRPPLHAPTGFTPSGRSR